MRVKYGSIVTDGSGKLGGHVASKGRSGSVIRTKVTGTNPQTPSQNSTRALLGSLAAGWSSLTEEQRQSFDNAVDKFKSTDIFGDIKTPSGYNLYIKLNFNLAISGQAQITTAPEKVEIPFALILGSTYYWNELPESAITFQNNNLDGLLIIISGTKVLSAGVSNFKSELRILGTEPVQYGSVLFTSYYYAKYGNTNDGDIFYFSIEVVMPNGQKGISQTIRTVVSTYS